MTFGGQKKPFQTKRDRKSDYTARHSIIRPCDDAAYMHRWTISHVDERRVHAVRLCTSQTV